MPRVQGALPVPIVTATLLPAVGKAPRDVIIHGEPGWRERIARGAVNQLACKRCGSLEHRTRRCDSLAATKALLKARRR